MVLACSHDASFTPFGLGFAKTPRAGVYPGDPGRELKGPIWRLSGGGTVDR